MCSAALIRLVRCERKFGNGCEGGMLDMVWMPKTAIEKSIERSNVTMLSKILCLLGTFENGNFSPSHSKSKSFFEI